jgi:hypothetical protein
MLTIKQSARTKRAVLMGAAGAETAEVRTDDKLRIRRLIVDIENKFVEAHFAIGHVHATDGWQDSGGIVSARLDAHEGRPNPLHDKTWQLFRQRMNANDGEISFGMIEQIVLERQLIDDVE